MTGLADWRDIFDAVPEMYRKHGLSGGHPGWVYAVKENMCRVCIGYDNEGKPMLTAWAPMDSAVGAGELARFLVEKGDNVVVHVKDGDLRQVKVSKVSIQKSKPLPQHDPNVKNGQTSQLGKLRMSMEKAGKRNAGYNDDSGGEYADPTKVDEGESDDHYKMNFIVWDDDKLDQHEDQKLDTTSSFDALSGDSALQKLTQRSSDNKPQMFYRLSEKGGFTAAMCGRDGKITMVMTATTDGVKIEDVKSKNYVTVTSDGAFSSAGAGDAIMHSAGKLYCNGADNRVSRPWRLGSKTPTNKVKNDDITK